MHHAELSPLPASASPPRARPLVWGVTVRQGALGSLVRLAAALRQAGAGYNCAMASRAWTPVR